MTMISIRRNSVQRTTSTMRPNGVVLWLLGLVILYPNDRGCITITAAQKDNGGGFTSSACETAGTNDTCDACIAAGCGWVDLPVGLQRCMKDCTSIADILCYSTATGYASPCAAAAADAANRKSCGAQNESCEQCVATEQGDGRLCQWYGYYCGTGGCDLLGCGQSTCPEGLSNSTDINNSTGNDNSLSCRDFDRNTTNCGQCLSNENCVWAAGQCLDSCNDIQDVSCYEPGDDNNATCAAWAREQADVATCAPLQDCVNCTATVLSDGVDRCLWYASDDDSTEAYCGIGGCDMNGVCGTNDCRPPPTTTPLNNNGCAANPSCVDCLGNNCVWTVGMCREACDIADVACYEPASDNGAMCAVVAKQEADRAICSKLEDCARCTATPLSDNGTGTCLWYAAVDDSANGYCGTGGCDFNGVCGASDCPAQLNGCVAGQSCEQCLGNNCVWTVGMCMEACDIQDVACYVAEGDYRATCAAATKEAADSAICSELDDCANCTATPLSDNGVDRCQWFSAANDTGNGYCGIGGCDLNGICGSSDCLIQQNGCGANQSCEACLESSCAWTVDTCRESCNVQDVACWEPGNNDTAVKCAAATKESADSAICSPLVGCANCTAALLSDGTGTCQWYPALSPVNNTNASGYCGIGGCDLNGVCGVRTCSQDDEQRPDSNVSSASRLGLSASLLILMIAVALSI